MTNAEIEEQFMQQAKIDAFAEETREWLHTKETTTMHTAIMAFLCIQVSMIQQADENASFEDAKNALKVAIDDLQEESTN